PIWLLHGSGSDRPEHHLRRVAGREYVAPELRDGRACHPAETELPAALYAVRRLDRHRASRYDQGRDRGAAPPHPGVAAPPAHRLGGHRSPLELEYAIPHLRPQSRDVLR